MSLCDRQSPIVFGLLCHYSERELAYAHAMTVKSHCRGIVMSLWHRHFPVVNGKLCHYRVEILLVGGYFDEEMVVILRSLGIFRGIFT